MLLASAILNVIGALFILIGAWVQARRGYREVRRHRDISISGVRVAECTLTHIENQQELPFWPSLRDFMKLTYSGQFGWLGILVGGALVLVGSVVGGIAAA